MNHCSGGNRCLAEICLVNPAAADDRKVPNAAKGVRIEGIAIIEAQQSEDCGRASPTAERATLNTGKAMKAVAPKKKSASRYDPFGP